MGILRTKTIEPATGSTLTLGASGDTITVSSDSIKANTFKDAGGNTLFTSDGAGTLSSVNSALAGGAGPILISTSTASDSSSIEITSGIDSTYDEYMFVFTDINPASTTSFNFQVNAAGQSGFNETVTNIRFNAFHKEDDSETEFSYDTSSDQAQGTAAIRLCNTSNGADECVAGVLHLFNPSSTTYVKHFYWRISAVCNSDPQSYSQDSLGAGYFNITAAIDEIKFYCNSGNLDGVIQMYGIK